MSQIIIYQNEEGKIKVDARFEDEGELDENAIVRKCRTVQNNRLITQ